ncbi:hypothetical protein LPB19_03725 [Marinobacter salinisoli]|uniref:Uncharacterized protein n=1 Tax=Marinobacter salinisoli TaxID=2769486 RepID=A0ABX7MT91_9GAMM|nr:hypothetical protein [Marinobacter salinisoli]QSP95536.1 hypothetical protein LPB19_03725 [Marinobacter salinisoli]
MKFISLLIFLVFFSGVVTAETKQRVIEIEMKPIGETTNKLVPLVRVPVIEGFSGYVENKKNMNNHEQFIRLMVETYSSADTVDGIQKIWDSRSFESVKKMLSSDPDIFDQNSKYYSRIEKSKVLGVVLYGSYEIIFVKHKISGSEEFRERYYPVYLQDGERVLSNEIGNDYFYQFIVSKIKPDLLERWSK